METFQPSALSGKQKAEVLGHLLLNSIAGNNDVQFGDGKKGNIGFGEGHFYTLDATQSFKFYDRPSDSGSGRYLNLFRDQLKVSPGEEKEFALELNRYLSRVEKLSRESIDQMYGPYFRSMKSFREFKQMPPFDYAGEVLKRISNARGEMLGFLDGKVSSVALDSLRKPLPVEKPIVSVPKSVSLANAADGSAKELLWHHYFQDFWKTRQEIEKKLGESLGVSDAQAIPALFQKAEAEKVAPAKNGTSSPVLPAEAPKSCSNFFQRMKDFAGK